MAENVAQQSEFQKIKDNYLGYYLCKYQKRKEYESSKPVYLTTSQTCLQDSWPGIVMKEFEPGTFGSVF